jgi:hypothetical protein
MCRLRSSSSTPWNAGSLRARARFLRGPRNDGHGGDSCFRVLPTLGGRLFPCLRRLHRASIARTLAIGNCHLLPLQASDLPFCVATRRQIPPAHPSQGRDTGSKSRWGCGESPGGKGCGGRVSLQRRHSWRVHGGGEQCGQFLGGLAVRSRGSPGTDVQGGPSLGVTAPAKADEPVCSPPAPGHHQRPPRAPQLLPLQGPDERYPGKDCARATVKVPHALLCDTPTTRWSESGRRSQSAWAAHVLRPRGMSGEFAQGVG